MAENGCRWCGMSLPIRRGSGRRREFCSTGCRSALHGRVRQLEVDRGRVVWELRMRREAVATARHKPTARRWVKALERQLAELDEALGRLRGKAVA